MRKVDPEKLLDQLARGKKLWLEDLRAVAALIEEFLEQKTRSVQAISLDDVYSAIIVLGKAQAFRFRQVLERLLDSRDALTVSKTLEVLTEEWKEIDEYLERVVQFALGCPWDKEHEVRQTALRILGDYLGQTQDRQKSRKRVGRKKNGALRRELVRLLLKNFEDPRKDPLTRQVAYVALCRSLGKDPTELPSEQRLLDLSDASPDVDWDVIEISRRIATQPTSTSSSSSRLSKLSSRTIASPGTR